MKERPKVAIKAKGTSLQKCVAYFREDSMPAVRVICTLGVLLWLVAAIDGLKSVFLSRFSSVNSEEFQTHIRDHVLPWKGKAGRLVYCGTAMSHYREESDKTRGEQRRKARYDAKKKMKELQTAFDLQDAALLELDREETTVETMKKMLSGDSLMLYVDGGNTFYLQKMMNDLDFWSVAVPAMEDSGAVYFGASAGSICAGATCEVALFKGWDDPYANGAIDKAYTWDKDTYKGPSLNGDKSLHLFPHFDPSTNAHDTLIKKEMAAILTPDSTVIALADDEALISGVEEEPYCWCSGVGARIHPRVYTQGG